MPCMLPLKVPEHEYDRTVIKLVNSVLWSGFLVFVFADGCWFLGQI
jgi:hypothetical protein